MELDAQRSYRYSVQTKSLVRWWRKYISLYFAHYLSLGNCSGDWNVCDNWSTWLTDGRVRSSTLVCLWSPLIMFSESRRHPRRHPRRDRWRDLCRNWRRYRWTDVWWYSSMIDALLLHSVVVCLSLKRSLLVWSCQDAVSRVVTARDPLDLLLYQT